MKVYSSRYLNKCYQKFWLWIIFMFVEIIYNVYSQEIVEFAPHVTATCRAGTMVIKVIFNSPYTGAVHTKDHRNKNCMVNGNGSTSVSLTLNLYPRQGQPDDCGILVSNVNGETAEERSVQLAVRVHKTLELADDKFYVITCGKTGFARDENSHVVLKFLDKNRRVRETVYGRQYTVKAEIMQPNGSYGITVKNCFGFDKKNSSLPLIDDRGCPVDPNIITRFEPDLDTASATALLKSMFKFPDSSEVHLQCDIVQCSGRCQEENIDCSKETSALAPYIKGRPIGEAADGMLLAATTVFVLEPGREALTAIDCDEGGVRPSWLLWLTIVLGILFLIMLLMNIFLCTAMSCSCARTEIIEKEPSIIEEYDPYRSWHGSQYGSRYSLQGRDGPHKGYTSGGSTIHSNRSLAIDTDHYAIVHSRPGSRHSAVNNRHLRRGSPSNY